MQWACRQSCPALDREQPQPSKGPGAPGGLGSGCWSQAPPTFPSSPRLLTLFLWTPESSCYSLTHLHLRGMGQVWTPRNLRAIPAANHRGVLGASLFRAILWSPSCTPQLGTRTMAVTSSLFYPRPAAPWVRATPVSAVPGTKSQISKNLTPGAVTTAWWSDVSVEVCATFHSPTPSQSAPGSSETWTGGCERGHREQVHTQSGRAQPPAILGRHPEVTATPQA